MDGEGRPIDGLRALLTAAWAAQAPTVREVDASTALRQLGFG